MIGLCRWEIIDGGQRCIACGRTITRATPRLDLVAMCRGEQLDGPCIHKGQEIDRVQPRGCKCQEAYPVYACDVRGRCAESFLPGVVCCLVCSEKKVK
jgi:hypothetical protein